MRHPHDLQALQLRCLIAAVRERNLTRAGAELGMDQPAVSRVLAQLRQILGDPLLVRGAAGMAPTPRAVELADEAAFILAALDRMRLPRTPFDPACETACFVLTAADYVERLLAPRLLQRLRVEAPGIGIEWRTPDPQRAREWLETGEVDLRVAWVHEPWEGFRFVRLANDRLVCLVPEGHVAARRLTLKQFLGASHVRPAIAVAAEASKRRSSSLTLGQYLGLRQAPEPPGGHRIDGRRDKAPTWHKHRSTRLDVVVLAQSFLAIPHLIASTDLMATVPSLVVKATGPVDGTRTLPPPVAFPLLQGALYWHERMHDDVPHRWFRGVVLTAAREAGL